MGSAAKLAGMEALKLTLSLGVFGAAICLCLMRLDFAGIGGLACGLVGFVGWFMTRGQASLGERLGNGYIGAFMGLCLGYAVGGAAEFIWTRLGS